MKSVSVPLTAIEQFSSLSQTFDQAAIPSRLMSGSNFSYPHEVIDGGRES
jgi:hypothetical protein